MPLPVIVFPNCKINLGLHIIQKRPDGFHNLETVFYPIPWQDALEVIHQDPPGEAAVGFTTSGISIDGDSNICVKAYELLKKDFSLPPVQLHLHKTIPVGAGLGGGSSDGAFALLLYNKKFNLHLSEEQLLHYAAILGSDCPFFIKNTPCFATGRGELLQPVSVDLSNYQLVIVNPQIAIHTGWAFSQITPHDQRPSLLHAIQQPVAEWRNVLTNDFEAPIFRHYPTIAAVKEALYQQGAVYASMSGSGSTLFALFKKEADLSLSFPQNYLVKKIT